MQEKRDKGICYRCDEPWQYGHRCKAKGLSILIVDDDDGVDSVSDGEDVTLMSVSLNSVIGIDGPETLKLLGVIKGQEVVVMIDTGATHNFISHVLVQ